MKTKRSATVKKYQYVIFTSIRINLRMLTLSQDHIFHVMITVKL